MGLSDTVSQWEANAENAFAVSLFLQGANACREQFVQRNHTSELFGVAVQNGEQIGRAHV